MMKVSTFPTRFDVDFFPICLMWRSCPASFCISFRGNCSVWSCRFEVSMGGGEFRNLLRCRLRLELSVGLLVEFPFLSEIPNLFTH